MTDARDPASIETLLQHASWVRGLAYSLVRNSADAEDLINETWLKTLQHPPAETGDLRGWFRRVMVHITRQNHRTRTARLAREAKVAGARRAESPEHLTERADTLRRVVTIVRGLPEHYQRAILMRHFEELSAGEIAQRLGEPVETIRTRLKRGYALVCERLEKEDGPDWRLALLPLLRWPLVPKSPSLFPPAAPPTAPTARWALRTATLVAVGIAIIVVTTVLWTSRDGGSEVSSGPRAAATGAGHARSGGRATASRHSTVAGTPRAPGPPEARPADPAGPPTETVALSGRIDTDAGPPPGTTRLHLTALVAAQSPKDPETRDVTAEDGAIRADLPLFDRAGRRVVEWDVRIDHPDYMPRSTRVRMPFPAEPGMTLRIDPVVLRRAGYVSGSVAFEPASAGDLATVGTVPYAGNYGTPYDSVTAAPGARFRVRAEPGTKMLVAAVANDRVPAALEVQVDAGAERDVGVLALAEGVRVSGRVGTRPRFPLMQKPTVSIIGTAPRPFAFPLGGRLIGYDGTVTWTYQLLTPVDPDGRFSVGGLLPGTFRLDDNATTGVPHSVKTATLTPFDAPTGHADFEYSGTLVRVLVRRGGAPAPGAVVDLGGTSGAVAGDDGIAQFIGRPGATYTVAVRLTRSAPVELKVDVPAAGEAPPITVELPDAVALPAPASWKVTIRPSSGEVPRVASFGFFLTTGGPASPNPKFTRDAKLEDGVFRVTDIPPGRWRVEIRPGARWYDPSSFLVAAPVEHEFAPGEAWTATVDAKPGGRLVLSALEADGSRAIDVSCRVLDAAHAEVPVSVAIPRVGATQIGSGARVQISPFAPTDVYAALPPGSYTVEFDQYPSGGLVRRSETVEVVAGKVAEAVARFPPR